MTKFVRVENADSNVQIQVKVEIWQVGQDGQPDTMVESHYLFNPTDLQTFTLYSGRYIKIFEELR